MRLTRVRPEAMRRKRKISDSLVDCSRRMTPTQTGEAPARFQHPVGLSQAAILGGTGSQRSRRCSRSARCRAPEALRIAVADDLANRTYSSDLSRQEFADEHLNPTPDLVANRAHGVHALAGRVV